MSIIITNDVETMGYLCFEEDGIDGVLATIWVRDMPSKNIEFYSKRYMYDAAKSFLASAMTEYSDYHRAKALMFADYVAWFETHKMN